MNGNGGLALPEEPSGGPAGRGDCFAPRLCSGQAVADLSGAAGGSEDEGMATLCLTSATLFLFAAGCGSAGDALVGNAACGSKEEDDEPSFMSRLKPRPTRPSRSVDSDSMRSALRAGSSRAAGGSKEGDEATDCCS